MASLHFNTDTDGNLIIKFEAEENDPTFIPVAALTMKLRADPDFFKEAMSWCMKRGLIKSGFTN